MSMQDSEPLTGSAANEAVADSLFQTLLRDAIRADRVATWAGGPTEQRAVVSDVGPTLYGGTAGIALALAHYAALRSVDWAMDLAVEAARHAYELRSTVPPHSRMGLFGGWTGIVLALAHVGSLTDDAALQTSARGLLQDLEQAPASGEFDVVSGYAGAVGGLALTTPMLGEQTLSLARVAAERLAVAGRQVRSGGIAWRSPRERQRLPLTGFAHGTAGVAWALLELANQLTGDSGRDALTALAERAFRYEDGLFQPTENNWPDLRHYPTWRTVDLRQPPCQVAWCHGAAGIALARLHAAASTGSAGHAVVARIATHTTAIASQRLQQHGVRGAPESAGLCHGLAGYRVVLGAAPTTSPTDLERIDSAMRTSAGNLLTGRGVDPGLMCGRAGIALCLLPLVRDSALTVMLGGPPQYEGPTTAVTSASIDVR